VKAVRSVLRSRPAGDLPEVESAGRGPLWSLV